MPGLVPTMDGGGSIATASSSSNPMLSVGSSGADVARLQRALGINADGIFGPQTQAAVRNYQQSHGLSVDGIVGNQTWGSLSGANAPAVQPNTKPIGAAPKIDGVGTQNVSVLPSSVTQSASQAPKPPTPTYSGPSINSVPKLAHAFGATYQYEPNSSTHLVNGQPVPVTSTVNGEPHGPVQQVAHAAGISPNAVQQNPSGGIDVYAEQVHPGYQNSAQYKNDVTNYGQYWADRLAEGGASRDPRFYGETIQQAKEHEAKMYGINVNQVQVTPGGNTWVPDQYVRAYLDHRNATQPAQQPTQATPGPAQQIGDLGSSFLRGVQQSAPTPPPQVQMPAFDLQGYLNQLAPITPFQWNSGQDFMNQYQAQMPAFQQQLTAADQKINDQENARGLFNSGIAQQNINTQNQALYGKLFDSIQKGTLADQKQAYSEWLGQANLLNKQNQDFLTNALNAYKANVQSLYDQGKLNLQQYQAGIGEWNDMVKAAQDVFNQQSKQIMQTQSEQAAMQRALIPYNYGPTPAQMLPYQYPTANALLPYEYQTANNQADNALRAAQYAVQDQQKWAQIMGVGPDGQPTLDAQKLQAQISHDAQTAATAAANASDNQVKTQISGLHDQLVAAGQFITNLTAQGVKANDPTMQQAIQNYNNIDGMIQAIVASMGTGQTSGASGPLVGTSSPQ